jgi:UrcA family protein
MKEFPMRTRFLLLLCLPLASVAAARDFHFAYSAADLVAPEEVYAQLDKAVAKYCGTVNDIRNLRALRACEQEVLAMAVEQIDHPRLTAYVQTSRENGRI